MDELEFTPEQWCAIYMVKVLDPDGWRDGTRKWDEPITFDEFRERLAVSTVKGGNDLFKE